MKKGIFKLIWKRIRAKNPKIANYIQIVAALLIAVFFGTDQVYDLCDLNEWLCNNKELIYTLLLAMAGGVQFTVKKEKKK